MKKENDKEYLGINHYKSNSITIIILLVGLIVFVLSALIFGFEFDKYQNTIVETYESTLDNIQVDYDDDNHRYDVYVYDTHYLVAEDKIKTLPYYKNEVVVEITRNGKCNLYFYIKFEVEE